VAKRTGVRWEQRAGGTASVRRHGAHQGVTADAALHPDRSRPHSRSDRSGVPALRSEGSERAGDAAFRRCGGRFAVRAIPWCVAIQGEWDDDRTQTGPPPGKPNLNPGGQECHEPCGSLQSRPVVRCSGPSGPAVRGVSGGGLRRGPAFRPRTVVPAFRSERTGRCAAFQAVVADVVLYSDSSRSRRRSDRPGVSAGGPRCDRSVRIAVPARRSGVSRRFSGWRSGAALRPLAAPPPLRSVRRFGGTRGDTRCVRIAATARGSGAAVVRFDSARTGDRNVRRYSLAWCRRAREPGPAPSLGPGEGLAVRQDAPPDAQIRFASSPAPRSGCARWLEFSATTLAPLASSDWRSVSSVARGLNA
jgi:hypothetical protein